MASIWSRENFLFFSIMNFPKGTLLRVAAVADGLTFVELEWQAIIFLFPGITSNIPCPQSPLLVKKLGMYFGASQVAQWVKNLPVVQGMPIQSPFWEDILEKGMATHSSILAWRIPWTEEPGRLQSIEFLRLDII